MEALKRVFTSLTLCGNVTPELSLSSGEFWIRCEHSAKHKKNISGTPVVKYKNYTEIFTVLSCCFQLLKRQIFMLSFSVHYNFALTGSYFISLLTFQQGPVKKYGWVF